MRIIHLANHCLFGHGNVHAAVDLACAQAAAGHQVFFASGGGFFEPLLKQNGVQHVYLEQARRSPLAVISAAMNLIKIMKRLQPDILHAHMMSGALIGYIATRLRRARLITTVHNSFDAHAILMGLGDRVIAVSNSVSKEMAARGVAASKLDVVYNGTVGAARRAGMSMSPAEIARPSLTTLCGLHNRKGVQDLIAAFDILSKANSAAHLYIIGEGPHEQSYVAQAAALQHASRIHFLGQLPDPNPYLLATDIFVLASHQEPFGLVITEAREAGSAIAASDVGGIPEVLAVGDAGVLFPSKNPPAIAQALLALLSDERALAELKTASGRDMGYFNIDRVRAETDDVYLKAHAGRGHSAATISGPKVLL